MLLTCVHAVRDYRRNNKYTMRTVDRAPLDIEKVCAHRCSGGVVVALVQLIRTDVVMSETRSACVGAYT